MNPKKAISALTVTIMVIAIPATALAAQNALQNPLADPGFTQQDPFAGTSNARLIPAITGIVNALLALAALIAAIFVVIGGVRYITSQGDEDAAASAKNTILYAAIGLIVIALSAVLVNFIVANIPGV